MVIGLLSGVGNARGAGWPTDDDSALPCRPTVSCTADLASPGLIEAEVGTQLRSVDGELQVTTPILLKLTLAEWLQLQVGSNGFTYLGGAPSSHYVDNLTLGAKLHLVGQDGLRPSLSVSASLSIPTVAQDGYTRAWDALVTGYASKDLGWLHLDLNVGLQA